MKALLLSNSTNYGESYMDWCNEIVAQFIGKSNGTFLFVPYAAVSFSYEQYTDMVNQALINHGIEVVNIDTVNDPIQALASCAGLFVGGGNTFHLLKTLQDKKLVGPIQDAIRDGAKYVGWSAGSNVAGLTIKTTNDMPIVEPQSFNALALVSYVINPHYTEGSIPNHGGETRSQRLEEYIAANRDVPVLCLPEASYALVDAGSSTYLGKSDGMMMSSLGIKHLKSGDHIQ